MKGSSRQPPSARDFSLYEGDLVNRFFGAIGLGPRKVSHLTGRALILMIATWVPTAGLALWGGQASLVVDASNFFADYAAYAQFLVGLPLFVVAEAVASRATRSAGIELAMSGVVKAKDLAGLKAINGTVARARRSWISDLVCLLIAISLSAAVIGSELYNLHQANDPMALTWHAVFSAGGWHISKPGWWEFGFALPLLNYWWLRQIWKIVLWTWYLYRVSRFRLDLMPTHPDRTAGIAFISTVQGHFAWLILAYGVSNVAATVGYKIAVEGAPIWLPPVWGPILGFIVIAPTLFLLPLFMFTRQLARAKTWALLRYGERVRAHSALFEAEVLKRQKITEATQPSVIDVAVMDQVAKQFDRIEHMRVVPFDFRSIAQLFGATLGSVTTILPALKIEVPATKFLEALVKLLEYFGGGH